MRSARVVVGAGFGDEGKGLLTDFFAKRDGVVVRHNGGAQAGHSVQLPSGARHVFHHFGAGSLRCASTHLSRHFIANPLMVVDERAALARLGKYPAVTADPRVLVTTPYDMMLNQMAEEARGGLRHGSCGLGINETIKRSEQASPLTLDMLADPASLALRLDAIRRDWVPARAEALGLAITPAWQARIGNDDILLAFVEAATKLDFAPLPDGEALRGFGDSGYPIVFEGAQGLLLDQDHAFFPHVTHSHTGLRNPMEVARAAGLDALDVTYVTRAYTTRHGAGPLPHETPGRRYPDPTNVPNEWQGTLRFGLLDLDLLARSVADDLASVRGSGILIRASLAITHLDQVRGDMRYVLGGNVRAETDQRRFLDVVAANTGLPIAFESHGPTRDDVVRRTVERSAA